VGAALIHADGHTDMAKETGASRDDGNAPKNNIFTNYFQLKNSTFVSPNELNVLTFHIQRPDGISAIPFDFVEVVH
jgi:hypothetical protein